jgi:hypothetical protein
MRTEAESKQKHGVWDRPDPMRELTVTSPYVHYRLDNKTFTIGNPVSESTLSPSQGLRIWPLNSAPDHSPNPPMIEGTD